jgi:hypothetical protein
MRIHLPLAISLCWAVPAAADDDDEPGDDPEDSEYGEARSWEIGGSLAARFSEDERNLIASPSVGYFIADRVEISAIVALSWTEVENESPEPNTTTRSTSLILEPSYHHPIDDNLQVLFGLGFGVGYDGDNPDLELIPRLGLNILTSRSNIITPALRVPIEFGKSHGDEEDEFGTAVGVLLEVSITTTW